MDSSVLASAVSGVLSIGFLAGLAKYDSTITYLTAILKADLFVPVVYQLFYCSVQHIRPPSPSSIGLDFADTLVGLPSIPHHRLLAPFIRFRFPETGCKDGFPRSNKASKFSARQFPSHSLICRRSIRTSCFVTNIPLIPVVGSSSRASTRSLTFAPSHWPPSLVQNTLRIPAHCI